MMDYKGGIKMCCSFLTRGDILPQKLSNIWMHRKVLKHSHLFASVLSIKLIDAYVGHLLRM